MVKRDFKKQYLFYGVPSPWLQVKLLRFHRLYPTPGSRPPFVVAAVH